MAKPRSEKEAPSPATLPFEKPIEEVRSRLAELEALASKTTTDLTEEIDFYRSRLERLTQEIYDKLTPWERVQVARHPDRPLTSDYVEHLCSDFVELRGDGYFGDDQAMLCGLATIRDRRVMIIGQRKGRTTKARLACNFGSSHPEGYRKALRKMRLAARLKLPIVCLVNTPGAYPGVGAEERGQARAIAESIFHMFGIRTPILVIVVGEGGSGGALGIAVGDRVGMLENAWYSVISPEGCASILWKSAEGKEQAATALKLTARDLLELGIIDVIIREPSGGAHRDPPATLTAVEKQIVSWLDELAAIPLDRLLAERHRKFRQVAMAPARAGGIAPTKEGQAARAERTSTGASARGVAPLMPPSPDGNGGTGGRPHPPGQA